MQRASIKILLFASLWTWTIQISATLDQTEGQAIQNLDRDVGDVDGDGDVDFDDLIKRISDTKAIGVLTKLSLKRDIDGFEADLEAYHAGGAASSLEQLHERYDLLVHKLVGLLQDKDPDLASDITRARDPLWARLADPDEFTRM